MLTINLLGNFTLSHNGQVIDVDHRPRVQALLAYLLLNRHRFQSRPETIVALWPDAAESQGRNRLRNLLHQLRQTLPEWETYLRIESTSLQWRSDGAYTLDVALFESRLEQAHGATNPAEREKLLLNALALYAGDLFPMNSDEWIEMARIELQGRFVQALGELVALAEERQDWGTARKHAERLLKQDPLHESAYCHLMRIHAQTGNLIGVTQIFEQCQTLLRQVLDVEPSEATRALYTQLIAQDPHINRLASDVLITQGPVALVGRDNEWNRLNQLWQEAQMGQSKLVVIQGEAGVGKTRLTQDFVSMAAQHPIYTASACCHAVEGDLAFAPAAEWLRTGQFWASLSSLEDEWLAEVARLLPELRSRFPSLTAPSSSQETWHQQHFFTALAIALLEHGEPVILCLDDIQWVDQETLDWLHYLIRYDTQTPLMVIATLRTDDAAERARCRPLMSELERNNRLAKIHLEPLSITETQTLAQQTLGRELFASHATQLYHETDGNPFFVIETVRANPHIFAFLHSASTTPEMEQRESIDAVRYLPAKVRTLIESRLARLSPLAVELMQIAAVIGRRFSCQLLLAISTRPEDELVEGIEELWQQNIVKEATADSYDFAHDKVREVAYAGLSPVRRRFLHRKAGEELVALCQESVAEISGQIGAHFEAAGLFTNAVTYYAQAGEKDAQRYAFAHAETTYANAIRLGRQISLPADELGKLYTERGRLLELSGEYASATTVYRELETFARIQGKQPLELEAILKLITCFNEPSIVHNREAAIELMEKGTTLAHQLGNFRVEVQILRTQMVDAAHYGYDDEAYRLGEAAITTAREHDFLDELGYVLNDLAANMRLSGKQKQAQAHAEEARYLFKKQENLPMLADNLAQQSWSDFQQVEFNSAIQVADQCIELCKRIKNDWNFYLAIQTKATVNLAKGRWGQAISDLETAIERGKMGGIGIAQVLATSLVGDLMRTFGNFEKADECHQAAHRVAQQQAPFFIHTVEAHLAMNDYRRGKIESGNRWLDAALEHLPCGAIARGWSVLTEVVRASVMRAEKTGRWQEAIDLAESAIVEAGERHLPVFLPNLYVEKGTCQIALGNYASAEKTLFKAIEMARETRRIPVLWQANKRLSQLYQNQARYNEAATHFQQAQIHAGQLENSLDREARTLFRQQHSAQRNSPSHKHCRKTVGYSSNIALNGTGARQAKPTLVLA